MDIEEFLKDFYLDAPCDLEADPESTTLLIEGMADSKLIEDLHLLVKVESLTANMLSKDASLLVVFPGSSFRNVGPNKEMLIKISISGDIAKLLLSHPTIPSNIVEGVYISKANNGDIFNLSDWSIYSPAMHEFPENINLKSAVAYRFTTSD